MAIVTFSFTRCRPISYRVDNGAAALFEIAKRTGADEVTFPTDRLLGIHGLGVTMKTRSIVSVTETPVAA